MTEKQHQVKNLGGLLTTYPSKQIDMVCNNKKCKKAYTGTIWYRVDGSEIPPRDLCPECRAEKYRRDQEQQLEKELEERKIAQREIWRSQYGVPGEFKQKTLENFDSNLQPRASAAISNLKCSIVLLSPDIYGVGKTHLVCALANRMIERENPAVLTEGMIFSLHCPVYYTNEARLLPRIRDTYNNENRKETEEDIFNSMATFDLLIIDDVGKNRPRDYSFLQGVYYRIIDDRYTSGRRIILTTNLGLTGLEEHIGGANADRLREMVGKTGFVVMKGDSYRKKP